MEYQSFFMLLKSFEIKDGLFYSTNPLSAHGFVQIKKEQEQYSVVIQINNFYKSSIAYVVYENNLAKIKIESATTKTNLNFEIGDRVCVFVEEYGFFACKNGTNDCLQSYKKVLESKNKKQSKNTLEKIFGKVYDTYFFDCIKPKLANLFALGEKCAFLENKFANSKWTKVKTQAEEKLFGIVYKDNFAFAIAIGSTKPQNHGENYKIDGKIYNILFLSASNGKIINF